MPKLTKNPFQKTSFKNLLPFIMLIILLGLLVATFENIFSDRFFPRVYIGDTNLTFLTKDIAYQELDTKLNSRLKEKVTFDYQNQSFAIDLSTASATMSYSKAVEEAYQTGRNGPLIKRILQQIRTPFAPVVITPDITLTLNHQLEDIKNSVNKPPEAATIQLDLQNNIQTTDSKDGLQLDEDQLKEEINHYLAFGSYNQHLPVKDSPPVFSSGDAQVAKQALEAVRQIPVKLTFNDSLWTIDPPTLFNLLSLGNKPGQLFDSQKMSDYVAKIGEEINRPVSEALFKFDGNRVNEFRVAENGQKLDQPKTISLIELALRGERPKEITLPVDVTVPKLKISDVNNLGIKELIGQGVSNFAGSIPNRIYNLKLAASRINGVLVAPGEVFSFNRAVGDISAASGYKPGYVIKGGRTVLDDGGGVCQDSTTLFRAVLNAGLPVVSRTAHAYRVGYYEQGFPPGLDATVFSPTVDFKFKNDTPAYILIQAYTKGTTLYYDFYGTPDGRTVQLTTPIVTNQTPPPEPLYQDDPSLPKGEVKQVDWPAWGANVRFSRTVSRDGQTLIQETYYSNFRPWQAVYLRGTKE